MRYTVLVAVVSLAVVAGCSSTPPPKSNATHTGSASAAASPHPTHGHTPVNWAVDPETACKGGKPFYSTSPPYTGAGPHRMIGFQLNDRSVDQKVHPPDEPGAFPVPWSAEDDDYAFGDVFATAPDASTFVRAQLALCMSAPHVTGKRAGSCSYTDEYNVSSGGNSYPVDRISAYYEFKVFEMRTGRLIKSFRLNGSPSGPCPSEISLGGNPKIAEAVDDDSLVAKLRPLVEGTAP